jgi:hypothetical protein
MGFAECRLNPEKFGPDAAVRLVGFTGERAPLYKKHKKHKMLNRHKAVI